MAVKVDNSCRSNFGIEARQQEVADQGMRPPRTGCPHPSGQQADSLSFAKEPLCVDRRVCRGRCRRLGVDFLEECHPHQEVTQIGIQIADIAQVETVLAELRTGANVALMCVCSDAATCHRSVIVAEIVRREPTLLVDPLGDRAAATLAR